jgi:hypothetical protein
MGEGSMNFRLRGAQERQNDGTLPPAGDLGRSPTSRLCDRGPSRCVEVWIENRLLIEMLDPRMMTEDYRNGMTRENWANMFALKRS